MSGVSERVPDDVTATPVERAETEVMFLAHRERAGRDAALLGAAGGAGRRSRPKFFGTFDPSTREYRVCVQVKEGDNAAALGLESGTLAGGRYLRARLRGEPPEVYERIGPTFAALVGAAQPDATRPSIELYRRRDEIDLLLPVVDSPTAIG